MHPGAGGLQRILVRRGNRVQHLQQQRQVVGLSPVPADQGVKEKLKVALKILHAQLVVLSGEEGAGVRTIIPCNEAFVKRHDGGAPTFVWGS